MIIWGSAANGQFNWPPASPDFNLSVLESEPTSIDLTDYGAGNFDGGAIAIRAHASPFGHVRQTALIELEYLPGTSIRQAHDFNYVLEDSRGNRAKGRVHVTVAPISDNRAFMGAEGFGAATQGGRGYGIYRVNQLVGDNTWGALRWALEQAQLNGGGIIVFDVAGPIVLDESPGTLSIPSNTTIAGETAPDPGITVFNREARIDEAHDVIIRHIRFRHGNPSAAPHIVGEDALTPHAGTGLLTDNVIIDHCSLSWGRDGTIDVWNTDRVTMQWCIISETLLQHSMGSVSRNEPPLEAGYLTFHHNLWAHHFRRSPRISDQMNADIINNVVYNWGGSGTYIGSIHCFINTRRSTCPTGTTWIFG